MKVPGWLSYANVMATIAVFSVLGGGAYAAIALPKNSVGPKQIKRGAVKASDIGRNAVTGGKVKPGSLDKSDFKVGELPAGPQGAQGPQGSQGAKGEPGPQGEPGSARAYARVASDGTLDPATSKNVIGASTAGASLICFELGFVPDSIVATIELYATDSANGAYGTVGSGRGVGTSACPAGTDAYTASSNVTGGNVRYPLFVVFN